MYRTKTVPFPHQPIIAITFDLDYVEEEYPGKFTSAQFALHTTNYVWTC